MVDRPRRLDASDMCCGEIEGPDGRRCVWGWMGLWWPHDAANAEQRRRFIRAYRQANKSEERSVIAHNDSACVTHQERADAINRALDLMEAMGEGSTG